MAFGPGQSLVPPVALQLVALVELQVNLDMPFGATPGGDAEIVTVGDGTTVTVVFAGVVPPAPVQLNVNCVVAVNAGVVNEPLAGRAPGQPAEPPDAVQLLALDVVHEIIDVCPDATEVGFADRLTVGAGVPTVTVTCAAVLPPAPVQVKVNCVVATNAGVVNIPLVGCAPLQPSDAVHDVAFVVDQMSCDVCPESTLVGLAERLTVGAGGPTVTVALLTVVPPVPVHDNVYVVVAISELNC